MQGWKLDNLKVEFDNPPHPNVIRFVVSMLFIPIVLATVVWVADGAQLRKLLVPVVGLILGVILFSVWAIRFYKWPPVRLTVYDGGIILFYKNKKETHAGWTDISGLYIGSTEPTGFYGIPKESMVKLKGDSRPKVIVLEAALLIKEQMQSRLGPTEATQRIHTWKK